MTLSIRFAWTLLLVCAVLIAGCSDPETEKKTYLENGNRFLADGKPREAIVEYRNAIGLDARYGEARLKLSEAHEATQNLPAAFAELIRAADLLEGNAAVQIKAGTYLLAARRLEDAKSRADRALAIEPKNIDALILRANAMAGLKDVPGAIREIEEALKGAEKDGRLYINLGYLQLAQGQSQEAEATLKRAIEVDPKSTQARLAAANFYASTSRIEDAERELRATLAIEPSHVLANRMLAALLIASGRPQLAEEPLKTAANQAKDLSAQLVLADYYVRIRRPDAAVPILNTLAANKPYFAAASLRLAEIDNMAGRKNEARKRVDDVLASEPKNASALTIKATWQLDSQDVEAAYKTAAAAVEADPNFVLAHYVRGRTQLATARPQEAITSFNEVLRLNPRVVAAQVQLAHAHVAVGDIATASQFATQAAKSQPGNPDVQFALARTLLIQGNTRAAESQVKTLLSSNPEQARTQTIDGLLRLRKNDDPGARAAFNRALERDPMYIQALEGLLMLDLRAKNPSAAVERMDTLLAKNNASAPLNYLAARTYAVSGNVQKAEAALRRTIELAPDNIAAYLSLGRLYASQRKLDEALREFDMAVAKRPDDVAAATMGAIIVQVQNKNDEAQKRYEAIVALNKPAPVAANNLAWIYAESGANLDKALQLAQSAKALLPAAAEIDDTLGWVYYKQNLPLLAIPAFEESVAKDKENASYRLHLGMAYAEAGQHIKARAALEAVLKLRPSGPEAEEARKLLSKL